MRASSLRVTRIVDDPSLGAGMKPCVFQQPARRRSRRTSMATLGPSGLALVVVLAFGLVATPAGAGQPTDQLRTEIDRALKVLDDPELQKEGRVRERRAAVPRNSNSNFHLSE